MWLLLSSLSVSPAMRNYVGETYHTLLLLLLLVLLFRFFEYTHTLSSYLLADVHVWRGLRGVCEGCQLVLVLVAGCPLSCHHEGVVSRSRILLSCCGVVHQDCLPPQAPSCLLWLLHGAGWWCCCYERHWVCAECQMKTLQISCCCVYVLDHPNDQALPPQLHRLHRLI